MAATKARGGARRRGGTPTAARRTRALPLVQALIAAHRSLEQLEVPHALVGGLAVSARATPRTTRDVDLAVSVTDDEAAEAVVFSLQRLGYRLEALVEQRKTKRLATARLRAPDRAHSGVVVDLLFASSGVEPELVARAQSVEVLPDVILPVALVADLLALKVLARDDRRRPQDADDLRALLEVATARDRAQVAVTLALIDRRGFGRGRSLLQHWRRALESYG